MENFENEINWDVVRKRYENWQKEIESYSEKILIFFLGLD